MQAEKNAVVYGPSRNGRRCGRTGLLDGPLGVPGALLHRSLTLQDVADAIVFVAADQARAMTATCHQPELRRHRRLVLELV
jgi:hypothetical protein